MSKIEWTEKVWNPVTGCDPVSPGCDNCYAKVMAKRLKAMGIHKYRNEFKVTCHPEVIYQPYKWKKPRMIFTGSMTDIFHHEVPDEFIMEIMMTTIGANWHTYQMLTKRPERMVRLFDKFIISPQNIWFGVTAENQKFADKRIPQLLNVPAAVRFVSCEPLLGEIDLTKLEGWCRSLEIDCLKGRDYHLDDGGQWTRNNKLDWIIIGCESGHNRRPCKLEWVRSIVDQCQNAQVPVFVKQLDIDGKVVKNIEEFPADLQVREYPKGATA